jgi:hypothetical protein
MVSQMLFCSCLIKGTHKVKQNYTHTHIHTHKNPTKCPKFKCNTVSVNFSACRCNSVVLSSKVGRKREKKRVWRQFWEWYLQLCLSARCCQPAVTGGVIYADVWGEISTYLALQALFTQSSPVREPLLQAFPFPIHWERWQCNRILRPACLFTVHVGSWSSPPLLCRFPPTTTFTSFPAPDYWAVLLLLPAAMFVYSS